ncbi:MAG: 4-hydroxy-3-methylbut-2-enyl diphosphate reductase, partial [Chitinophagaceae bacterium]|nr:4-hydroxy-3-methylbut-2-enyl diphosphate reductase [Chitinophagaceae bacterium]
GGYNSSNTSHLVELCEEKLPTFFISGPEKIRDQFSIEHFNWRTKETLVTNKFLPEEKDLTIMITSGASCPDALVEQVITRIVSFFPNAKTVEEISKEFLTD